MPTAILIRFASGDGGDCDQLVASLTKEASHDLHGKETPRSSEKQDVVECKASVKS